MQTKKNYTKLDQLTSLRFFAAWMIVIHHSIGLFGIKGFGINLSQGVSFFFILSGFILTYVYPTLDNWAETKRFWRARIARILPAYLASSLLGFLLLGYVWDIKTAIPYLLMVQAWIPLSTYFFAYNTVSWSVSTEFFFYLIFPFLLYKWRNNWLLKLLLSAAILIILLVISNALSLPSYYQALDKYGIELSGLSITQDGLIYINPLARTFEFIFGMIIAFVWRKNNRLTSSNNTLTSSGFSTISELGAIIMCIFSMYYMGFISTWVSGSILGLSTAIWLGGSGSMLAFGLLIYIIAQGRGKISKILCIPFLVLLGEISFSLYLIHKILLDFYVKNISNFSSLSNLSAFIIFSIISLLSSYLIWSLIEMPGRKLILGSNKIHGTRVMKKTWRNYLTASRKTLLAGIILLCITGFLYLRGNSISQNQAKDMTPTSLKVYLGTNFQNVATLRGLRVECKTTGLNIKLAWQSGGISKNRLTNGIHLIDNSGNILEQADYKQPRNVPYLNSDDIWLDTLTIPAEKISENMTGLAISMYSDPSSLILINSDRTDWGGRRLIIRLDSCKHSAVDQ
jgi:peptidoglycan/LPS O-acetylase OafA/YrhL